MKRWLVFATDSTNDQWRVVRDGTPVATIWWTGRIDFPMAARDRIENGLNGVHGGSQPPRCWSFGPEAPVGAWSILHNGTALGEWVWQLPPRCEPDVWQSMVLAGLNYLSPGHRHIPPPAPAAPRHLERAS